MKIISWNVNGIRSLFNFFESNQTSLKEWLDANKVDILCIQETKIGRANQVPDKFLFIDGYESFWSDCKKPGYSGVVSYVKKGMTCDSIRLFGKDEYDDEGRIIMTDHINFILFNVYFPNSRNGTRLSYKLGFYEWFKDIVKEYIHKHKRKVIVTGDVNSPHSSIDLFEPEVFDEGKYTKEREWLDNILLSRSDNMGGEIGFIDAFRFLNKNKRKYTWWKYRRSLEKGYRIDYFFVDEDFKDNIESCDMMTEQLGSDHCPIYLILNIDIVKTDIVASLSSEKKLKSQPKIFSFFNKNLKSKRDDSDIYIPDSKRMKK